MSDYRRPGVYLEEVLQTSPNQQGTANAVAVFAGVAPKGDAGQAIRVDSWADYAQKFGGFDTVNVTDGTAPAVDSSIISFLPYAVFNYYQNGGRTAYIVRVLPTAAGASGDNATIDVVDDADGAVFSIGANGVGAWGNDLEVIIAKQAMDPSTPPRLIFSLQVRQVIGASTNILETFNNLSMTGVAGTRPVVAAINDPIAGSRYITASAPDVANPGADPAPDVLTLAGGKNPGTPLAADLVGTDITNAMRQIDAPLLASFQPFRKADGSYVMPPAQAISVNLNQGRLDAFVIWDGNPLGAAPSYVNDVVTRAGAIGSAYSYDAIYCPWIIVPDPARPGSTIIVPPSGSVQGMMSRMDATIGPWRAPAGLPAVLSTALGAEVKFSDTDQGSLNYQNINVIRAVQGGGICVMGARTRKLYGPDRYVNARRTLIYIEDSLKLSTQFAVFENNDQRLWTALRETARQILDPIWQRGGLSGSTAAEAFYIICDRSINTPQVIQSGEVRMEVGVALQFPAEFVVIRVSQYDSGASLATEVVPGQIAA